jgi:TolB-like protein/tetratricopeptide (TPR) repeat protein
LLHDGEVVLKAQLLEAGWPGRVVSENSLAKAIGRLRQALGDPDGEVLATVHGYGYRLVPAVEFLGRTAGSPTADRPALPVAPLVAPVPARPSRPDPLRLGALVSMLVVSAALAVWLLRLDGGGHPTRAPAAPAVVPQMRSIAVLPFADLSRDQDQSYFSDGLADELLDQLAKVPQLRVAGRTSSFAFRGKDDDVASIGRKLNVRHVLEGSVRKSGDRIRITVQLIDTATGFHTWSETYDRHMTELFEVQDDIARSVVAALQVELLPEQSALVLRHETANAEAFTQFLMGRAFRHRATPDDDRRAIVAFERAIALDPRFASAYAGLGDVLGGSAEYADSPGEVAAGKQRSLRMMDKAIALDPARADTYLARADLLYSTNWDWAGAQRDLDRAAALAPGDDYQRMVRQCRLLAALGRLPEAIAIERRMTQVAPAAPGGWSLLGYHSAALGELAQARAALRQAQLLLPDDDHVSFYLGLTSLLEHRPEQALVEFQRGGGAFRLAGLAMASHDAGRERDADALLAALESKYAGTAAYQVAEVLAWRGRVGPAFDWLERAERQRDAGLIFIRFDPLLARLRGDPRYAAWLRRMHLPS